MSEITLGGYYIPGTTRELKHDPAKVKNKNEYTKSPYDLKKGDPLYVNQLPRSRTVIRGRFTRTTGSVRVGIMATSQSHVLPRNEASYSQ